MLNALKEIFFSKDNAPSAKEASKISNELIEKWERDGYLILPGFCSKKDVEAFQQYVSNLSVSRSHLQSPITIDILEGKYAGARKLLRDAPDEALMVSHKLNDLYLESEECRTLNLSDNLSELLSILLQGQPVAINSLTFKKGSQQPYHFDTYYMPPPKENKMVVTSICLEDQCENVGPLTYYPGSHKIPPYRFSHGGIHATPDEMPNATSYIENEIKDRQLTPETFIGKTGDVFIWHAQLYHGGSAINNHNKTRQTLVTHYWRKEDMPRQDIREMGNGAYLQRDHQKVG